MDAIPCAKCKLRPGKPVQFYFAKQLETSETQENGKVVKAIHYDIALSQPVSICLGCAKNQYQEQLLKIVRVGLGVILLGIAIYLFAPIISVEQLQLLGMIGGGVSIAGVLLLIGTLYEYVMMRRLREEDDTTRLEPSRKLAAISVMQPALINEGYDTFWAELPHNMRVEK